MTTNKRKILATVLIIFVSIVLFFAFMYIFAMGNKNIPMYSPLIFAFLPALAINTIWSKARKRNV